MLGRFILNRMLLDLGILREGETIEQDQAFEHLFRNMWADNADIVSKSYSGSGAMKTDFTRTGERTKKGALADLNSAITRYIKNNFLDGPKQDACDVFLGTYRPASQLGRGSIFADTRPLVIQGIPYILIAAIILLLVGSFTKRGSNDAVWPLRLVMIISFFIAVICIHFMWANGKLFVSVMKQLYNSILTFLR